MERYKEIERSIITKFRPTIWRLFLRGVEEYKLIQENDKIAVCISGGKDSMLLAKCMQELQLHGDIKFELCFICMDPGYATANRELIEKNAETLNIPIHFFETNIFNVVNNMKESPCYLCARMRRGNLYAEAKKLGCNKIALGHHFDDVVETILLSMFYASEYKTMMPKLHSENFEGMELIRPMYLIREDAIKAWRDYNNLRFLQCACHFTETCSTCNEDGTTASKRLDTKRLIAKLKENNPYVEGNIFKSVENVNIDTIIEYKKNGVRHNFLETYNNEPT